MKAGGLKSLMPALLLAVLGAGAVAGGLLYRRHRAEQRYEGAAALMLTWYQVLPPPTVFRVRRAEFLEASERMLGQGSRRGAVRQQRLLALLLSLDPVGLQREVRAYTSEQSGFSNKDPLLHVPQMLFDCWRMPAPDSVERRRLEDLQAQQPPHRPLVERDWYRGVLLRRFVEAKRLLQEPAKADAELTALLEYAPWFPQAWYLRGRVRLSEGDAAGALLDFQEAVRLDPTRPELFRWTAQAFEAAGRRDSAKAALVRALALEPDYPEARELEERLR